MSGDMRPTAMIGVGWLAGEQRRSCFCCGEVGHFARDCLQRVNRKSPGAALSCFACGWPGHFARDCPNKFTPNRNRNRPSRPNHTGINRAGGTSAGGGEGGPNRMSAVGGDGGPNRTAGNTRAAGTSAVGGEGGPNGTAGITRVTSTTVGGLNRVSTGGGKGGPNQTAGITRAGFMSAGEGDPNRTAEITRAGVMSAGEGGPNYTAGITRAVSMSADRGEGGPNRFGITRGGSMSSYGGGGPNLTTGITRAGYRTADRGEAGSNRTAGGTSAVGGESSPNRTAGITRARGTGAGGGIWIRRRELPADQSKDLSSINGGGVGGVSSSNQRSYFPPTLSREHEGSGSLPDEPVNESYHNVNLKYDTSKFCGSNRDYSNLLNSTKGGCGEGSSSSSKDSGDGRSARGLFLNAIRSSSSGNDFDDDDYKGFDMLSRTLLSEGKILEKRCGFVAKASEGIDGERSRNGKSLNKGTMSRGSAVIELSSSSSEDEDELIVRKKSTGSLFPIGEVKEEIKRVVDDDDDDDDEDDDYDDDDDDCVILDCNPFEPPTADFEQVSLSEHKSSVVHDEDITIISERGQVACRDYPHSRHHCAKFPFSKTTDESCCPQCYCYICEVVAPCEYWNGGLGHCHASDQHPIWGVMKKFHRDL